MKNAEFTIEQKAANRFYFFLNENEKLLITSAEQPTHKAATEAVGQFTKLAAADETFVTEEIPNNPKPHRFVLNDEAGNLVGVSKNFKHKGTCTKTRNRLIKHCTRLVKDFKES